MWARREYHAKTQVRARTADRPDFSSAPPADRHVRTAQGANHPPRPLPLAPVAGTGVVPCRTADPMCARNISVQANLLPRPAHPGIAEDVRRLAIPSTRLSHFMPGGFDVVIAPRSRLDNLRVRSRVWK